MITVPDCRVHAIPMVDGHPFRQWRTWTLPGTEITVSGYSRAGDKTYFDVPRLRLGLDAGLVEGRRPETVLLTHTHLDHVKDLDYLAVRPGGADLYVPADALAHVHAYLRATTEVNQVAAYDEALAPAARIHGVRPGDEFPIGRRGAHTVRVLPTRHKVPSVGYLVSEHGKELLPDLAAARTTLSQAEFGQLMAARRRAGEPVERQVTRPLFAYLGDTHASALAGADWLAGVPVVITECTFLDEGERERADRVGHTLWADLRPVVAAHPATTFVLTHFSLRYSDREVLAFFEREQREQAAGGPSNIVLWAGDDSLLPQSYGV